MFVGHLGWYNSLPASLTGDQKWKFASCDLILESQREPFAVSCLEGTLGVNVNKNNVASALIWSRTSTWFYEKRASELVTSSVYAYGKRMIFLEGRYTQRT